MNIKEYVDNLCIRAKNAAKQISCIDENTKNLILKAIIDELDNNREKIISANNNDVEEFKLSKNFARSFLDRLLINNERIDAIIESIKEIILFKDPVGEIKDIKTMPSGIKVGKMAMPLGVIAMIYESRPNVTIDASADIGLIFFNFFNSWRHFFSTSFGILAFVIALLRLVVSSLPSSISPSSF